MKKLFPVLLAILLLCGCAHGADLPEDVIDTEYFTLPLLAGVHHNILPDGDRYAIEFYESQDYETNGTGLLCTLKLYKEGEDFTVPGHTLYGVLVTKKADFEVVALYPTEVTYTPANANQHQELQKLIGNMLTYDLEPKDGVKWLRPQPEGTSISDERIEMQYYTVNLPEGWIGKYVDFIEEFEDGTSIISFYEKESYEDFGGGLIVSIRLLASDVEWSSVPGAFLAGSLDTPEGDFTLIGVRAEDIQYSKDTKETYEAMYDLTSTLFSGIHAKEGCTLHRTGFRTDRPSDSFS